MTASDPRLAEYRRAYPQSRAVRTYYLAHNSGVKRAYGCVFCRAVLDTESADFPMTRHARRAIAEHACERQDWRAP